jgi:IS66 C-terminal element
VLKYDPDMAENSRYGGAGGGRPRAKERAVRRLRPRRGQLGGRVLTDRDCKLNDVEPQAYIEGVLTKLLNLWPSSRIDESHAMGLGARAEQH